MKASMMVECVFFPRSVDGHLAVQSFLLDKCGIDTKMNAVGNTGPIGLWLPSRAQTIYPEQWVVVFPDGRIEQYSEFLFKKWFLIGIDIGTVEKGTVPGNPTATWMRQ